MTVARLRVLLAHHDPEEAFAVAAGRARPAPAVAAPAARRDVARGVAGVGRAGATRTTGPSACRRCGIDAVTGRDADVPGAAAPRPAAAGGAVRPRRPRRRSTPAGSASSAPATPPSAGRDTAVELGRGSPTPAWPSCPGWPRASTAPPTAARSASPAAGRSPSSATGPTAPYPRVTRRAVGRGRARAALLLSEWPPGTPPEPFRFPLRNRILAALSEVLVVVESRERGGSLITAQAAIERSRRRDGGARLACATGPRPAPTSCCATAPRRSPASTTCSSPSASTPGGPGRRRTTRDRCRGASRPTCWPPAASDPRTLDDVVVGLGLPIAEAAMALARLERDGLGPRGRRLVRAGGVMVRARR